MNKQKCGVILQILKDYENAPRQQNNFMKSFLQFGHKVPDLVRFEVQQILEKIQSVVWEPIWVFRKVLEDQKLRYLV